MPGVTFMAQQKDALKHRQQILQMVEYRLQQHIHMSAWSATYARSCSLKPLFVVLRVTATMVFLQPCGP